MNLPTDPKERMKMILVIVIFAVGILLAAIQFGVRPILAKNKKKVATIEDLQNKLRKANKTINRIPRLQQENAKIINQIKARADRFALQPTFGDYLLGAKEIVEKSALAGGAPKPAVLEIGPADVVQPPRQKEPNNFKMYSVRVTMKVGIHKVIPFMFELEKKNPYVSVSKLAIAANLAAPDQPSVSLEVQWPVWADAKMQTELDNQLTEAESAAERVRKPAAK